MTQDVIQNLGTVPEGVEDYFGFDDFKQFDMPDGVQWIKFKVMNEGDRSRFQKRTNRDIKISKNSGDAAISTDVASERHELIKMSVVDWYMFGRLTPGGPLEPVGFTVSSGKVNLESWLAKANPKLVDDLELAIRLGNPWMQNDMTTEEIDQEISRLEDLRREVSAREAAK